MMLNFADALLAMAQPPGQSNGSWLGGPVIPLLLMVVVFYFLMIRPQQKKAKDHDTMMKAIRSGDKIVTSSGIVGIVVAVKEKTVSIRSADTKLEVLKSAVTEITERSGEPSPSTP